MKKMLLVGLLVAGNVQADTSMNYVDGNALLNRMNGEASDMMYAIGYVAGVSDVGQGVTHCAPANVTVGQATDMVKQYLANNPGDRHYQADTIIKNILTSTWPCRRGKTL